ncbi:putative plant-like oligopeptide transporter [Mycena rebaudengoi]|nr:putative plant-like oligopeptide transporter [Mycena rebaudengoi]
MMGLLLVDSEALRTRYGSNPSLTNIYLRTPHTLSLSMDEKLPAATDVPEIESKDNQSSDIDESDPEYSSIPRLVRDTVSFEDDPTATTITFRFFVLSTIFCCAGSFVGQLTFYRTTYANFSIFFIILMSWPLGKLMERIVPSHTINLFGWRFSLNPGPFSGKEHVLIGLAGNAGAQGMSSSFFAANAKVFYDIDMNPFAALFFGWATQVIGFSFAAMTRQILIYNPAFIFPPSLQQVKLYRGVQHGGDPATQRRQMRGFWLIFGGAFIWQFFPEFIFPMTSSLAPLCWISRNKAVNFIGSGIGGMGFLTWTLDWSNISSSIITVPWFVQVNVIIGSILIIWVLVPIVHFGKLWGSPTYSEMSNGVFTKNGSHYPFKSILTPDGQLNVTRYEAVGLAYTGAQFRWDFFFSYAAYTAAFAWMACFYGPDIIRTVKAKLNKSPVSNDRLSNIMKTYPEVSAWEWLILFLASFVTIVVLVTNGHLYMPLFTLFVGLAFGALATLPMSLIYAISGYSVSIGVFNELIYGYMLDAPGSSRHPLGQLAYRIISGHVWYDIQTLIADQKIGHYMHIPPRAVIFSQLWGSLIGIAVNYAVMLWILETKIDFLRGTKKDPNGQWTGQSLVSYNTHGVQYGIIGPKRLFEDPIYKVLPYGFLVGILVPIILWLLHRKFKGPRFELWNAPIFFTNIANFRGAITTGGLTVIAGGYIWAFWLYRYHYKFWTMWAYITGAALDTGFNLNLLFLFATVGAVGVSMPNWWGNNKVSVERCFHK